MRPSRAAWQMNRLGPVNLRGHTFCGAFLNRNSVVVDLGAHTGEFSHAVAARFGCRVYALEPVPALFDRIVPSGLVRTFNLAVSRSSGTVEFHCAVNPEAGSLKRLPAEISERTISVQAVSFDDFIETNQIGSIDLLKIDIEGSEIEVLETAKPEVLRGIGQITVEFHDMHPFLISPQDVHEVKQRLASLGFHSVRFTRHGNGDVLFLNQERLSLDWIDYLRLRCGTKLRFGIGRVLARNLPQRWSRDADLAWGSSAKVADRVE